MQVKTQLRYTRDGSRYLAFVNVNAVSRKHALNKVDKIAEREGAEDWEAKIVSVHPTTDREIVNWRSA